MLRCLDCFFSGKQRSAESESLSPWFRWRRAVLSHVAFAFSATERELRQKAPNDCNSTAAQQEDCDGLGVLGLPTCLRPLIVPVSRIIVAGR
jgi:hypothetical protein